MDDREKDGLQAGVHNSEEEEACGHGDDVQEGDGYGL